VPPPPSALVHVDSLESYQENFFQRALAILRGVPPPPPLEPPRRGTCPDRRVTLAIVGKLGRLSSRLSSGLTSAQSALTGSSADSLGCAAPSAASADAKGTPPWLIASASAASAVSAVSAVSSHAPPSCKSTESDPEWLKEAATNLRASKRASDGQESDGQEDAAPTATSSAPTAAASPASSSHPCSSHPCAGASAPTEEGLRQHTLGLRQHALEMGRPAGEIGSHTSADGRAPLVYQVEARRRIPPEK